MITLYCSILKHTFRQVSSLQLQRSVATSLVLTNKRVNMDFSLNEPITQTSQGKVRGSISQLLDDKQFYSFKGIPYAEPPVGKLRFMAPQPPKSWSGIYDATNHKDVCPQIDFETQDIIEGNEDCLYLNVYTTDLKTLKPVMVFIHGGAFMSGSGNDHMYGPKYLLKHDVVLVTFNYRLELIGFMSLDIPEVPGNAGMKDQVFALKWVKENIHNFGGDPDNVTIFGESAGGVSVTHHLVSKMSRGLFHKAITQSGTNLSSWGLNSDVKERTFRVGKFLGKDTNDPYELLSFLQSLPATDLVKVTFKTLTKTEKYYSAAIFFSPVIEKNFANVEPFLDTHPLDLLRDGSINRVPILAGYNSSEGQIMYKITLKVIDKIIENPRYRIPRDLLKYISKDHIDNVCKDVRKLYFKSNDKESIDKAICDLESDTNFTVCVHRFLDFYTQVAETTNFMYIFDLITDLNFTKLIAGTAEMEGACHGDDLFYIFNNEATKSIYDEQDKVRMLVNLVTKLWTNFAKTGNPTPDNSLGVAWTPYNPEKKAYLHLGHPMSVKNYPDRERIEFWNRVYDEAGLSLRVKSRSRL